MWETRHRQAPEENSTRMDYCKGKGQEDGQKSSPAQVLEKRRVRVRLLFRVRT